MSKTRYSEAAPRPVRLGDWLRQLREQQRLPLREVADAAGMDLAHLQKIELGQRLPTEKQASRLAKFFKLDETETQARRIAEKFQHEFAEHPAAKEAIGILAEEAGVYEGRKASPSVRTTTGSKKAESRAKGGKGAKQ
jgi:transcriptional regulator with XRE-family HTH domain